MGSFIPFPFPFGYGPYGSLSRMLKRMEEGSLLKGFKVGNAIGDGLGVSRLLFADDTVLFYDAKLTRFSRFKWCLLVCGGDSPKSQFE